MARMFESEEELLATLGRFDGLVRDCASGDISFDEFLSEYGNFYTTYALDGHESDPAEQKLFEAYEDRIRPHRIIWEKVLCGGLCSDEDARKESYVQAGRFGSDEALRRLRAIINHV